MSTQDDEDELDRISELAQERRDAATAQLSRALPDVITSIHQTEIAYTFDPSAMPLSQVDADRLIEQLEAKFGLGLPTPDLGPLLQKLSKEEVLELSAREAVAAILRSGPDGGVVNFENGKFSTGRDEFVPILGVSFNRERLHVSVRGIGAHAELLAAEMMELIWACTGSPKRWEALEQKLQIRGYATGTFVDLGTSFQEFLNPRLVSFVDEHVVDGKRFAAHADDFLAQDGFGPPPGAMLTWALGSVDLELFRFDQRNGRYGHTTLRFRVPTRSDYGGSRIHVSSELPFDVHVACIVELSEVLRAGHDPSAGRPSH